MKKIITHFIALVCMIASGSFAATAQQTAYGYLFGSKDAKQGFVSFDTSSPRNLNLIKSVYSDIHPSAGEYVDGKIYTYQVEFGDFTAIYADGWAVYDGETLQKLESKYMLMNRMVDMTYDYTTNTLYGLIEDVITSGVLYPTSLCAIDMATGQYTVLGSPGELTAIDGYGYEAIDGLVTLACDAKGQLWAMSSYRYLYKIDKHTCKVEQVGERHNLATAEQFQSMAFDADGRLWWAQQHPSYGHFVEVDLETAIPGGFVDWRTDYDKLDKLGDDAQVTALYFKDKEVRKQSIKAVTDLKAEVDGANVHTVNISWTLPSLDYSGQPAAATGVKVYRIGVSEPVAILDGTATSFTDTDVPDGEVIYEVIASNEAGEGFPAFTTVFAGYDQLCSVSDIEISLEGSEVTLTWKAPESTVNGGYSDYDAITYNISRVLGDNVTPVAEGLAATTYTETLSASGGYSYIIKPVSGGIVGEPAQSDIVILKGVASIPYFTGFEDDGDGSQWTFINHPDSKGWSLGAEYYIYDGKKTANGMTNGKPADDWMMSPAIEFAAGQYELDYFANGSSFDTHTYDVCLGTDAADPTTFTKVLKSVNNEYVYEKGGLNTSGKDDGWTHVKVNFNVEAPGTYHLGFHNMTTSIYAKLRIDNLQIKKSATSGVMIEQADESSDAPVEYFNLSGVKISTPTAPGIYIRRQGTKAVKIVL